MVLVFKSSTPEVKLVGIARATAASVSAGPCSHRITFAGGTNREPERHRHQGSGMEAVVAIADLLNRSANEYEQDRARGDRPRDNMQRDRNVRVDEHGHGGAPVNNYTKR
jgi:hypothetical protein